MIYISTGGVKDQIASKTALYFYDNGIRNIELSGGSFSDSYEADLKSLPADLRLQVHNYFPPCADPFVLNLSSIDPRIEKLSSNHIRKAMRLCLSIERPIYSFHAGFRIDPHVRELGQKLSKFPMMERGQALAVFSERVDALSNEARSLGVTLLIENNVINSHNLEVYGEDPLLLTHPDEIARFMSNAPSNVGFLLDVAHLKVSARSLGFDLSMAHEQLKPWIGAYHLSDNDGISDSNEPVDEESWFWSSLKRDVEFYTLEVYDTSPADLLLQHDLVQKKLSTAQ